MWADPSIVGFTSKTEENNISVFPNPSTGVIKINAINIEKIEIKDLHGKLIYTGIEKEIDLSTHAKGVYIINISAKEGVTTEKIVLE